VDARRVRERLDASNARCVTVTLALDSVSTPVHLWLPTQITTRTPTPRAIHAPFAAELLLGQAVLSARLPLGISLEGRVVRSLSIDDVIFLSSADPQAMDRGYRGAVQVAVLGARR
jgi:hypothetical protein